MSLRPFASFALMTMMTGIACAGPEDPAPVAKAPADEPTRALLKQAIEAADKEDLPRGIALAEKALKQAPVDRDALFLLGAMTQVRADQAKDKAERIALFRRSSEVLRKLEKTYKVLQPQEQGFLAQLPYGEARASALEGKPKEAIASIREAIANGLDDIGLIEKEADLESLRALPEFAEIREALAKQVRANVAKEMAESRSFPFDFALDDVDDKPVKLDDYKGKVTIVDVWGTWCPPCRMEIPHFVELYKEYRDKGLEIVGINCNEGDSKESAKKAIKDFAAEQKIPYKCVLNDDKTEGKIPGFQGYPTTLFLDRSGKVRLTLVGYTPKPKLDAIVSTLLAEPAEAAKP